MVFIVAATSAAVINVIIMVIENPKLLSQIRVSFGVVSEQDQRRPEQKEAFSFNLHISTCLPLTRVAPFIPYFCNTSSLMIITLYTFNVKME